MAEVAAGLWAAEEAVSTVAQAGVGAYMVAKPTAPLKATFTQIATSSDDGTRLSLSRSGHTLSIINNKAYIFGGETANGQLASNDIHAVKLQSSEDAEPDYSLIPAVPQTQGGKVPAARRNHAACALNICVAVFGGIDEAGETVDENGNIWLYNTNAPRWEVLKPADPELIPKARSSAHLFEYRNSLVLYGGTDATGAALSDVWHFDYVSKVWSQLPDAPLSSSNAALTDGVLYLLSATDNIGGDLHFLPFAAKGPENRIWNTVPFPTSPLTPGPAPRTAAGLLSVSTGFGRQYLLYFFGACGTTGPATAENTASSEPIEAAKDALSDLWTYQLPSSDSEAKLTTNIYEAIKPAKIKDKIRQALGVDDGKHSWAEVEVLPPSDLVIPEGKVHPGPRSSFAFNVMDDKRSVVVWGGVNPKGEREGDGWIIKLE